MINPLPNNSEDSLKIFYHLTEETRYPALILFILSIVICLSISKGKYGKPYRNFAGKFLIFRCKVV